MKKIATKKTVLVRVNKKLKQELSFRFPEVNSADLFQMMYNTSALKAVGTGRRIFGNDKKKKKIFK